MRGFFDFTLETSEDKLVFDGGIYNFEELKRELTGRGISNICAFAVFPLEKLHIVPESPLKFPEKYRQCGFSQAPVQKFHTVPPLLQQPLFPNFPARLELSSQRKSYF